MSKNIVIGCLFGLVIMLIPAIISGNLLYSHSNNMGGLLIAEFIMRIVAFIIGLLIIYDTTKEKQ